MSLADSLRELRHRLTDPWDLLTGEERDILGQLRRYRHGSSYWVEGEGDAVRFVQRQPDWRPEQYLRRGRPAASEDEHLMACLNLAGDRYGAEPVRAALNRAIEVFS